MIWVLLVTVGLFVGVGCAETPQVSEADVLAVPIKSHHQDQKIVALIFGDFGFGNVHQLVLGKTMKSVCDRKQCDLAITVGDNIYPEGISSLNWWQTRKMERQFERSYDEFGRFDFWISLGNHDWRGSVQSQIEYTALSPRWRLPARYYAIPHLPEWFNVFVIDTFPMLKPGLVPSGDIDLQLIKAEEALCGKPGWRIIVGHHPIFTSGRGVNGGLHKLLLPLIKKCKINFFWAGHEHHQEHIKSPEFHQIIQGAAAKPRDTGSRLDKNGVRSLFASDELGFAVAEVWPSELNMSFYNKNGKVIYTFKLP